MSASIRLTPNGSCTNGRCEAITRRAAENDRSAGPMETPSTTAPSKAPNATMIGPRADTGRSSRTGTLHLVSRRRPVRPPVAAAWCSRRGPMLGQRRLHRLQQVDDAWTPKREAMSSLSVTTWPLWTAVIADHPGLAATVWALCPQQMVSARKIQSGFDCTMNSADSCGYPPLSAAEGARSAMLCNPRSPMTCPMNVDDVAEK